MLTPQTRRRFLTTLSLAGASGVLRPRRPCAAEGALETTSVRLPKFSSICVSPQYAAEELLRAEGFTDVPRPSRFPISPGRSAPLAREMLRRLGPRSPISTKSRPKLAAAKDAYWAGQTRIQKQAAIAWVMFSEGQRDEAVAAMRKAADLDDASEKTVAMENKLVPIRSC